jgi:hypothetical protein
MVQTYVILPTPDVLKPRLIGELIKKGFRYWIDEWNKVFSSLETIHYYATKAYRTLKIDSRDNLQRNPAPLPLLPNKNTGRDKQGPKELQLQLGFPECVLPSFKGCSNIEALFLWDCAFSKWSNKDDLTKQLQSLVTSLTQLPSFSKMVLMVGSDRRYWTELFLRTLLIPHISELQLGVDFSVIQSYKDQPLADRKHLLQVLCAAFQGNRRLVSFVTDPIFDHEIVKTSIVPILRENRIEILRVSINRLTEELSPQQFGSWIEARLALEEVDEVRRVILNECFYPYIICGWIRMYFQSQVEEE